ncbi:topless-related protein 4-like isoform X2 [Cornus florida]|uniref:topless-related protein 4-like isoform X2 n=1 Tax=Cornus florida TaxID=4283 RepID=UPI002899AAC2|nr:topless-related protein 4-like isoform X2 [Cornus florida]XP_059644506.1 topless-related protein 4-like isoform X2 [Cornus florida]XP_059644507.1 topless-related protein 4-like isoform X3 [Cornus florida]XP_059644508.1 topless-related protein 4-like isoform X2 [Cornus florida]XP_059644509.1 topless-related protein 4-like isoform X2 [Cornus florida]
MPPQSSGLFYERGELMGMGGVGKKKIRLFSRIIVNFDTIKNKYLVAGDSNLIKFWDMNNSHLLTTSDAGGNLPTTPAICCNREGTLLAVSANDNNIKILASVANDTGAITASGTFTKSTFGDSNLIKFWDMNNSDLLTTSDVCGNLPTTPAICCNREGTLLVVSANDNNIKILASVANDTGAITAFGTFTKSTFGDSNLIKFWDMNNSDLLTTSDAGGNLPTTPAICCNREGTLLAVSVNDNNIKILASVANDTGAITASGTFTKGVDKNDPDRERWEKIIEEKKIRHLQTLAIQLAKFYLLIQEVTFTAVSNGSTCRNAWFPCSSLG